jgi:hypothetical protein
MERRPGRQDIGFCPNRVIPVNGYRSSKTMKQFHDFENNFGGKTVDRGHGRGQASTPLASRAALRIVMWGKPKDIGRIIL